MKRLFSVILFLFLFFSQSILFAQNIVFKTNFGNDDIDNGYRVLSPDHRLMALVNRGTINNKITLWDLNNKVVIYSIDSNIFNTTKEENTSSFSSVSFSPDGTYLGYIRSDHDSKKDIWEDTYFIYDISQKKLVKEIKLEGVFTASFLSKKELLLRDCFNYCSEINWFKFDIVTGNKTLIKTVISESWEGFENMASTNNHNGNTYLILDDKQLSLVNSYSALKPKLIESPNNFVADTTYLTNITLSPNLKYALFIRPKASSVVDLESGSVIIDNLPFPNSWSFEDDYEFSGLMSKNEDQFLFMDRYDKETNSMHLKSFNIISKRVNDVAVVKKDDYEVYKFINGPLKELYDFSKLKTDIEFKKTCHALLPETNIFGIHDMYFVSAFNDMNISIFNCNSGEIKSLTLPEFNGLKRASIDKMVFYDTKVLLAYSYWISGTKWVKIIELDLKSRASIRALNFKAFDWCNNLQISKNNDKLLVSLKNRNGIGDSTLLIDLKTFKDETPELFENRYYHTIYLTNNDTYIVGYIKNKGSYVYDKASFKFIAFHPENLVFYSKGEIYKLHLEYNTEIIEYEDYCDTCPENITIIKDEVVSATGHLIVENNGQIQKIKADEITTDLWDNIDENLLNFKQDGNQLSVSYKGNMLCDINLKKAKMGTFLSEAPIFPKLNKGRKPIFLVGIDHNTSIKTYFDNGIKKEKVYGNNIAYTSALGKNTYDLTTMENLNFMYDYKYVNNTTIAALMAPYNVGIGVIKSQEDYEYSSVWLPEKYQSYPSITMDIDEKYYAETLNLYVDDENSMENMSLSIDYNNLEDEEKVLFESMTYRFIDFDTQSISNFTLKEAFQYLAPIPFISVNSDIYICDKSANKTLKLKVFNKNEGVSSRITPWDKIYNWKTDTGNAYFSSQSSDQNGIVSLSNNNAPDLNAQVLFTKGTNFSISFPDNYYMTSKDLLKYSYFKKDTLVFRPEQFDLKFNRPDIVLNRLGYANKSLIQAFHKMYLKRLKKTGVSEAQFSEKIQLASISVENKFELPSITSDKTIVLNIKAQDLNTNIKTLNIWNNDVPVTLADVALKNLDLSKINTKVEINLTKGTNKIQTSVVNSNGVESLKETVIIECTTGKEKPDLYLISIGVSAYENSDYNLKYAAKDAVDIVNLYSKSEVYGKVHTKTLLDNGVSIANIEGLKSFLDTAEIDDVVMVFIASHGLLDDDYNYYLASHNIDFNNPSTNGIPYNTLERLLDNILPLKKIMFIDACHSGEVDVDEVVVDAALNESPINARGAKPINIKSKTKNLDQITSIGSMLFSDLRRGNGTTVISSAGGLEFAFEGDKWQNGLFTYCFLNGISSQKADLNGDGKIMLSELQNHITKQVKLLSNGKQTPTSRIENLAVDYRVW